MSIDRIETVLLDHAVDEDEDVKNAWDLHVNEHVIRVKAATKATWPEPAGAWTAARDLAFEICGADYELTGSGRLGAVRLERDKDTWRGSLDLVLRRS